MDDVRHLAAFVAVADLLHLGRAATRLGIPRTTLSDRLRALERQLAVQLVDRRHRCRIALTPGGAAVLPAARAVVDAGDALVSSVANVRSGLRGVVRVALVTSSRERDAGRTSRSHGGDSDDCQGGRLSDLGRYGKELVDALGADGEPWTIELRWMDRWSAQRAMAVGGLECAISAGPPLLLGPGALDPRPHRLERARSISIGGGRGVRTSVTWRASWASESADAEWSAEATSARSAAEDTAAGSAVHAPDAGSAVRAPDAGSAVRASGAGCGAVRVRDRLVETAERLRQSELDERAPRSAARRRAAEERRRVVHEKRRRLAEVTRLHGAEVAAARSLAEERLEVLERFEAARTTGEVGVHLAIAWMCAVTQPDGCAQTIALRLE